MVDNFKAVHFVAGLPSAIILGIIGIVASGVAVSLGFMPALINGINTDIAIGSAVFISELVYKAYQEKSKDSN